MAQSGTVDTVSFAAADFAPTRKGPLLVAVDGDANAVVLHAAAIIAHRDRRDVVALQVLEGIPTSGTGLEFAMPPMRLGSDAYDDAVASMARHVAHASDGTSGWSSRVTYGDPARTITDTALEEHASLIVMGIGRHAPIHRLTGAETTLRAVRRAHCPVLCVSPEFAGLPHTVVVATDFSPACARAAQLVLPLLADGARLHFVHVWTPLNLGTAQTRELDAAYRDALDERFARLVRVVDPPAHLQVSHEVQEGALADTLLGVAEAIGADLIVAGREGLNAFERLMVGSVSASLLRGATCSVFVARAPLFADVDNLQRLLTGRSEGTSGEQWSAQLDAFSRRNVQRRTTLQSSYPKLGAETLETGFALIGAMYDPGDERVELMFGDPGGASAHFTRSIAQVRTITILTGGDGTDTGLQIDHRDGLTLVTLFAA